MKFLRRPPDPIDEDVYIDLTERLAPYTKEVEASDAPSRPASFMRERPLRATPQGANR